MVGAEVTAPFRGDGRARIMEPTEVDLMEAVFPHPTLSEAMHEAVHDAFGRAVPF